MSNGTINLPAASSAVLTISGSLGGGGTTWNYTPGSQMRWAAPELQRHRLHLAAVADGDRHVHTVHHHSAGGVSPASRRARDSGPKFQHRAQSFTFAASGGTAVTLTVSGSTGNLYWTGVGSSVWYNGTSSRPTGTTPTGPATATTSMRVMPSPSATPKLATDLDHSGMVAPSRLIVSNTATAYTFNGPGSITGSVQLQKSGPGALVLAESNSYSGGTAVANGSLVLNNSNALGSGTLTISGGSLDNTSGSPITLATANPQNWNADFTFVGSNDLNVGTGAVAMSSSRTVSVNAANLTVGGAISAQGSALLRPVRAC